MYGDVSISPLYVFKSSFAGIVRLAEDDAEILGVLSLIFWIFTLVLVVKYAFIVLQADDNGEGNESIHVYVCMYLCIQNPYSFNHVKYARQERKGLLGS